MNSKFYSGMLAAIAMLATGPVLAQPASRERPATCFVYSQIQNWKADGNKTIYLRVSPGRYYRLDLAGPCPSITYPGAFLITRILGTTSICAPIDWDLHVSQSWNDIPQACIVKNMKELSKSEVAAIPPKSKP